MSDQGVCTHSSPSFWSSYVVFAVDGGPYYEAAFMAWALEHKIGYKPLVGSYKGQVERSFIINQKDLSKVSGWIAKQESILVLGPANRDGKRPARLAFVSADFADIELGLFQKVGKEWAMREEAWTFDPSDQSYWICREPEVKPVRARNAAGQFVKAAA